MRWTDLVALRSFRWRGAEKKLFLALIALATVFTKRQWPDLPPVYVLISIGSQVNPLSFSDLGEKASYGAYAEATQAELRTTSPGKEYRKIHTWEKLKINTFRNGFIKNNDYDYYLLVCLFYQDTSPNIGVGSRIFFVIYLYLCFTHYNLTLEYF